MLYNHNTARTFTITLTPNIGCINLCSDTFNAKELDEENGMYYYSARYYAPPTFISRDEKFEEFPTISPYCYTQNNPLRFVDPTGKETEDIYWHPDKQGNLIADKGDNPATLSKYLGISDEKAIGLFSNLKNWDGGNNTEGIKDVEGHTLTINASSGETNKTPWMDIAKTQIGVTEATGHNDGVQVEKYLKSVGLGKGQPWCAAFVNWSLNQAGKEGAGARGNNYLNWGVPLDEPKYGAVAIFNTGHVGFYAGKNGENYKILHGNWSDKVSFSTNIKPSEIKSFRFPK